MKTIEITDEQYDFLINLSKELKTQDNRITADPIFCVYQKIEVLKPNGYGDEIGYLPDDGSFHEQGLMILEELQKTDEFKIYRKEHPEDNDLTDEEILLDRMNYKKIEFSIEEIPVSGQCYFSENAAQNHIKQNSYHYNKPFIFVESAWRNYEWEKIREIILSLDSKK